MEFPIVKAKRDFGISAIIAIAVAVAAAEAAAYAAGLALGTTIPTAHMLNNLTQGHCESIDSPGKHQCASRHGNPDSKPKSGLTTKVIGHVDCYRTDGLSSECPRTMHYTDTLF